MEQKTMRAAVFAGEGRLELQWRPIPTIRQPDAVLVRVEACSVCGTDVHIMGVPPGYIAKPGTVLGHELVGTVVQTGDGVRTLAVGDRVVCNPNDYCGTCVYCRKNLPNLCENIRPLGIEVDGGFAEYVLLREQVAYRIPPELPAETAMFAEPLACLVNGTQKLRVQPGERVLVIGGGPIGLLLVCLLKRLGAGCIIVSEPGTARREQAQRSGAHVVVDPQREDLNGVVRRHTGIGADYVADMTGSQLPAAVESVRKGGTVLLFGVNAGAVPPLAQSTITQKQVAVLGTWLANDSFPQAVELLSGGLLEVGHLVTHRYPLERVGEAIEVLRRGEGVKICINPNRKEDPGGMV